MSESEMKNRMFPVIALMAASLALVLTSVNYQRQVRIDTARARCEMRKELNQELDNYRKRTGHEHPSVKRPDLSICREQ